MNTVRFKTILSHINLLNILLIGMIAALSAYTIPSFLKAKVNYALPAPKKSAEEKEEKSVPLQIPSMTEYAIIAEQNLFHPERKIPVEKKGEQQLPKPEFVLYGTLMTGDTKLAFLEDIKAPYSTAGRGKRQKALRLGNALSGFTLSEVHTDRVIMVRGEEKVEVKLVDPQHKKVRATETTAPPPAPKKAVIAPPGLPPQPRTRQ